MVLQPLTTGQLLDRTFSLYRKHAVLFMAIGCVPHLVYLLGMAGFQMTAAVAARGAFLGLGIFGFALVLFFVYLATIGMAQAATAMAVSDVYLGKQTSISSAYRRARGKWLRYMGIVFGIGLLSFVGLILLIIPGIYFAITYALSLVISANENLGWSKATQRSKFLVKGNRNRIGIIMLLSIVITYAAVFAFTIPATMLSTMLVKDFPVLANLAVLIAGFLASTLAAPVALIGFTLAYYDARVKKEAFDLQMMMDEPAQTMAATQGA